MGFLRIFSGKKPEEYEQRGDTFLSEKEYAAAKIEYEAALDRLERISQNNEPLKGRIQQKITQAKEFLALRHQQAGKELIESENYEEAEEKIRLAMELTEDPERMVELEEELRKVENHFARDMEGFSDFDLRRDEDEAEDDPDYQEQVDEYFTILCSSLPEKMSEVYQNYGHDFKIGYVALNQGEFDLAATRLSQAMKENSYPDSFIPLELAKAYMNLSRYEESISLLELFLKNQPDLIQGYQLLCEAYWEIKRFDLAQKVLSSCPSELGNSLAIYLLRGETLLQAQEYRQAEAFYLDYLKSSGWDDNIARALAITYEALGEKEKARDLFGEILDECRGCGFRPDPFIKRKYAGLCFETGNYSTKILEMFISLVHDDPDNRLSYYQKIAQIYSAQGNEQQARRYQLFVKKLEDERKE